MIVIHKKSLFSVEVTVKSRRHFAGKVIDTGIQTVWKKGDTYPNFSKKDFFIRLDWAEFANWKRFTEELF